jgi:phage gp16-like protein
VKAEKVDQKKLALIHIIKKELQLSESEYRAILKETAGVTSARDLTPESFQKLMRYFVRSKHYVLNQNGLTMRQKMFIKSLFFDLGWTAEHSMNFLQKYYHKTEIEWLTKQEASKVIEALKHIKSSETKGHEG